jgi:hypothetical protein
MLEDYAKKSWHKTLSSYVRAKLLQPA